MAAKVDLPVRWISAITARVVALALVACSDLAARARATVSTVPAVPSFRPPRLAAARARLCPLADQVAFLLGKAGVNVQHKRIDVRPHLSHEERHPVRHKPRDEMNVSPEAAELRHDGRRFEAACMGESCRELGGDGRARHGLCRSRPRHTRRRWSHPPDGRRLRPWRAGPLSLSWPAYVLKWSHLAECMVGPTCWYRHFRRLLFWGPHA
jgi:hypothetical protein